MSFLSHHPVLVPLACRPPSCLGPVVVSCSTPSGSRCCVILPSPWVPLACRPPPCLGPVGVSSSTLSGSRWRVVLHPVLVPLLCRPPPCLGTVAVSSFLLPGSRLLCHPSYLLHVSYCCIIYHPGAGCRVILLPVAGCVPFIFPVGRSLLFSHPSLCSSTRLLHPTCVSPTLPSHPPYFTHPTVTSTSDSSISVPEHSPQT